MVKKLSRLKAFTLIVFLVLSGEFACKALTIGDCEGFSWSPDGKEIALKTEKAIYVMNTGSSQRHQVDVSNSGKGYTSDVPVWSPDGQQILFSAAPKNTDTKGIYQLYIVSKDKSQGGQLLISNGSSPQWSPTGKQISFQSYKDGRWKIYVMNVNGSKLTELAPDSTPGERPMWSPDGKYILFSISPTVGKTEVYVVAASGLEKPKKLKNGNSPAWSHDEEKIAYINSALEVHTLNQKSLEDSRIYQLPVTKAYKYGIEWGSDNSKLFTWLVSCKESRVFSYNDCDLKIYSVDLKHLNQIRQISFAAVGTSPIWSSDREKIGFISQGFLYTVRHPRRSRWLDECDRPKGGCALPRVPVG